MTKDEDGTKADTTKKQENGGMRRNLHSFPYTSNLDGQQQVKPKVNLRKLTLGPNDDGSAGGSSDYGISSSNENSPPNSPMQKCSSASLSSLLNREYRPLIERMKKMIDNNESFFSMEFFPPKTANGVANLLAR